MVSRIDPPKPKRSDDPVVARGQDAWEQLQEDAPRRRALSRGPGDKAIERREKSQSEHRRWWREVGEALAAGKRATKTSHEYYAWLKANNLDDIPRPVRASAIWFVANIESLGVLPDGLASPGVIRQWANKQDAASHAREAHVAESTPTDPSCAHGAVPIAATRSALEQGEGDIANVPHIASLLLEVAVHLQRGSDLMLEVAYAIQKYEPHVEIRSS